MTEPVQFEAYPSIKRLSRECVVTEKIDGTNAQVYVAADGTVLAGSRNRWITPEADNFGFARWVRDNEDALRTQLGIGRHYGEWWGPGIQRGYGLKGKRFSLFNTSLWSEPKADGRLTVCDVVPVLYRGIFSTEAIDNVLEQLNANGSVASPGFMRPEGIVVYHTQTNTLFKKTLDKNDVHKQQEAA